MTMQKLLFIWINQNTEKGKFINTKMANLFTQTAIVWLLKLLIRAVVLTLTHIVISKSYWESGILLKFNVYLLMFNKCIFVEMMQKTIIHYKYRQNNYIFIVGCFRCAKKKTCLIVILRVLCSFADLKMLINYLIWLDSKIHMVN